VVAARPDVRVLYLPGYAADALERHGTRPADLMVLRKPFTPEALLRAVRQALEAGRGPEGLDARADPEHLEID